MSLLSKIYGWMSFPKRAFIFLCIASLTVSVLFPIWTLHQRDEDGFKMQSVRRFMIMKPSGDQRASAPATIDFTNNLVMLFMWILYSTVACWIYACGHQAIFTGTHTVSQVCFVALLAGLFFALSTSITLGTHSVNIYTGGGAPMPVDTVRDFYPTFRERIDSAIEVFVLLITPAVFGVYQGVRDRKQPNA